MRIDTPAARRNLRNIASARCRAGARHQFLRRTRTAPAKPAFLKALTCFSHGASFARRKARCSSGAERSGRHSRRCSIALGRPTRSSDMLSFRGRGWQMKINGDRASTLAAGLRGIRRWSASSPAVHALISGRQRGVGGAFSTGICSTWNMVSLPPRATFARTLQQRNALLKANERPKRARICGTWSLRERGERLSTLRERFSSALPLNWRIFSPYSCLSLARRRSSLARGWADEASTRSMRSPKRTTMDVRRVAIRRAARIARTGRFVRACAAARAAVAGAGKALRAGAASSRKRACSPRSAGEPPIVALDDFASELDGPHQRTAMRPAARHRLRRSSSPERRDACRFAASTDRRRLHVPRGTGTRARLDIITDCAAVRGRATNE